MADIRSSIDLIYMAVNHDTSCGATSLFAKSGDTVVGTYIGADIEKASVVRMLDRLASHLESNADRGDRATL
jgi:hypothetical protein